MRRQRVHAFVTMAVAATLMAGLSAKPAGADPVLVFPGMEIHQGVHLCTLAYVDPARRVAFTAGHCQGDGAVTDHDGNVIGAQAVSRSNMPSGATVAADQPIDDYEEIVLTNDVAANNILPGGRPLQSQPGLAVAPGEAVCHFGIITGESCGTVERVNNGWFTMTNGVASQMGDSGGPVYIVTSDGPAVIVGIFNSVWGPFPAAVSWRSAARQVREDLGLTPAGDGPVPPA